MPKRDIKIEFQVTPALNFFGLTPDATQWDIERAYQKLRQENSPDASFVNLQVMNIAQAARDALRKHDPALPPDDFKVEKKLLDKYKRAIQVTRLVRGRPQAYLSGSWLWIDDQVWPSDEDKIMKSGQWRDKPTWWDPESEPGSNASWFFRPLHGAKSKGRGRSKATDIKSKYGNVDLSKPRSRRMGRSQIEDEEDIDVFVTDEVAEEE